MVKFLVMSTAARRGLASVPFDQAKVQQVCSLDQCGPYCYRCGIAAVIVSARLIEAQQVCSLDQRGPYCCHCGIAAVTVSARLIEAQQVCSLDQRGP